MKALLLLMLLTSNDDFFTGQRAYQEGRFQDALKAFTQAEKATGNLTSAELLYNKAMAAFRAGELMVAEIAAEKAAAHGGPRFFAGRDFLLGHVAFLRCEKAEEKASQPEAEPFAFDPAIGHGETARNFWQRAAASRLDWPEARRNVERALLKIKELKKKKEEAKQKKKKTQDKKKKEIKPDPRVQPPKLKDKPGDSEQEIKPEPHLVELPLKRVMDLFDLLDEKEKEKLRLRRAQQRSRRHEVEKDW